MKPTKHCLDDAKFIREDQAWLNQQFDNLPLSELPVAPAESQYDDVLVVFSHMTAGDEEKGFVPGYHFRILDCDNNDVGHINIRVGDTAHVNFAAGHLGYEIDQSYQGNRYATKACLALSSWLRSHLESVLITVDPDNMASIKTIEKLGAHFIDKVNVPVDDPHYLRGSIVKLRYNWQP